MVRTVIRWPEVAPFAGHVFLSSKKGFHGISRSPRRTPRRGPSQNRDDEPLARVCVSSCRAVSTPFAAQYNTAAQGITYIMLLYYIVHNVIRITTSKCIVLSSKCCITTIEVELYVLSRPDTFTRTSRRYILLFLLYTRLGEHVTKDTRFAGGFACSISSNSTRMSSRPASRVLRRRCRRRCCFCVYTVRKLQLNRKLAHVAGKTTMTCSVCGDYIITSVFYVRHVTAPCSVAIARS